MNVVNAFVSVCRHVKSELITRFSYGIRFFRLP